MTPDEIKKLIDEGEYGKAWHALGELTHKKGGAQPNVAPGDGGDSGNTPTPPPPPPGH